MRTVRFNERNRSGNRLHIETPLGIVNITIGLHDADGRRVESVEIIPNAYAGEQSVYRDGWANTRLLEANPGEPRRVDRTCERCGKDRGALYEAADSKGDPLGLFCEPCVLDVRAEHAQTT